MDPEQSSQVGDYRRNLQANPHDSKVAPSALSRQAQRVLVIIFLLVIATGLFFVAIDRWRRGTTAIGAGMVFLAAIRWVVDSDVLGIFAVRSRKFDSIFTAVIGLLLMYLSISANLGAG